MPNLNLVEQQSSLMKTAPALLETRIFTSFLLVYYIVKAQECRRCKTMSFDPIRKHCCKCDK